MQTRDIYLHFTRNNIWANSNNEYEYEYIGNWRVQVHLWWMSSEYE